MKIVYRGGGSGACFVVGVFSAIPAIALSTVCAAFACGYMVASGFTQSSVWSAVAASTIPLIIVAILFNTLFEFKKFEFKGGLKLSFEEEGLSSQVNDVQANQREGNMLVRS